MSAKTVVNIIYLLALLACFGCSGGGKILLAVSDIDGPGSLHENQAADYSVTVKNKADVQYAWTVDPVSAGSLVNADKAKATFCANECTANTKAKLGVSISGWKVEPEVVEMEITIMDTNQAPRAAASSDATRIGHGNQVHFFNESTDPQGDNDIVKWAWDFNYKADLGFIPESDLKEPQFKYDTPGIFRVQLRVTDKSGVTDMLDEPLSIEVVENYAPEIVSITHSRTTSQAGNDNEAVQLEVQFNDFTPPDGPHIIAWHCDYGHFDDFTSQTPKWFPPDAAAKCHITAEITDEFGLSDMGTIHQWVTSFSVLNNSSAPGNTVISRDFDTAFTGSVDPADRIFPADGGDGTVILTSYWALWSSTCLDEIPLLLDINAQYRGENYLQFMIDEGDSRNDVIDFVNLHSYSADVWALDSDATYFNLSKGWNSGSSTLPQHMVFDRDGHCRWASAGVLTAPADMQLAIEELL